MKRRNINKTIMQRGGLMIEALAMLGLIAVVTPTMYKKSAERTMEVEDINTAATIRTVMNAANDYVSSNYSWLISQMNANGQTVRDITAADIRPFLPYGFNLSQPLHNYNAPILKVKRPSTDSNNLTAFALFPATAAPDDGIGQERTSRIAALVGSNGGYKPTANTARGVGGIWSLNEGDFRDVFGNQGNQYSIVTASTDIINSATNNEVDMTKYLQRGSDNAAGTEWKNTMRTDLYMGGPNQDGDIYENLNGPYSIRNIKSLIVGTNAGEETGNYGLYIAPEAANPNAYVHGSLKAGEGQFKADNANLQFGGTEGAWNFVVSNVGKVMNRGDLELASDSGVWKDIKIGALQNNGSNKYLIQGSKSHPAASGGMSEPYDYGSLTFMDDLMKLTDARIVKDKKVKIMENGWAKDEDGNAYEDIKYQTYVHSSEDAGIPEFPVEIDANAKVKGLLAAGQIDTNKIRTASLSVGSEYVNSDYQWMTVDKDGVLIADPSRDTDNPTNTKNRINVNKDQIVLSVDKDAKEVTHPRGDGASDGHETSAHDAQIIMNAKNTVGVKNSDGTDGVVTKDASIEIKAPNTSIHGNSTTVSGKGTLVQAGSSTDYGVMGNNLNDNSLLMRNDNMQIRLTDKETVIGPRSQTVTGVDYEADDEYKVRTTFHKGNLDLLDSNLNILDANEHPVFSVGTNGKLDGFTTPYADIYTARTGEKLNEVEIAADKRETSTGSKYKYDVAAHGNIIFTDKLVPEKAGARHDWHHTYLSIGDEFNKFAAVNIMAVSLASDDSHFDQNEDPLDMKNIVMIDQGASNQYKKNKDGIYTNQKINRNNKNLAETGTIYIRKGYLEAIGSTKITDLTSNTHYNDAKSGNGVIVASRFVANNPEVDNRPGKYGATFANYINGQSEYEPAGTLKPYDTYMVNPAYTSVMHDIKLTTRGGARLSDVLPDFINKGIYVVSNTYQEKPNDKLSFSNWPKFCPDHKMNATGGRMTIYDLQFNRDSCSKDDSGYYDQIKSITLGKTWASPFLGVVPAPQCPPGYGRVITLNPASFDVGLAGQLKQATGETRYYVAPIASMKASDVADSINKETEFVQAKVQGVKDASMRINETSAGGTVNGAVDVSDLKNINTNEYVLSANGSKLKPLVIQQSTHLKSQIQPIKSSSGYVRGWATIMGFLYYNGYYQAFGAPNDNKYSWNIFPVLPDTIEGYATVYCYFNRTNLKLDGKSEGFASGYEYYVDPYNYMVNMQNPPNSYKKKSKADVRDGEGWKEDTESIDHYQERLNDPELKYNEVW